MITKMVICVTDTNIECHPTIHLFQIIFHIGTVLNNKINNIQITITDKVKEALDKSPEVVITYKTVTDALPGWYSNFASVDGFSGYSDFVFYYVEGEAEPSVEKSVKINEDGSQARWDETFDWKSVDGSNCLCQAS